MLPQTVALSEEEKNRLRQDNLKGVLIATLILGVIATIASLVVMAIEREFFFIVYIIGIIFLLIVWAIIYQYYLSMRDLKTGTKQIYQDRITDKRHEIVHSSSGSGNNRTSTTHHYYYFTLEQQGTIKVTEKYYQTFRQGQTIQVEHLTYSKTLWNILLINDDASSDALPTPTFQIETASLEPTEIANLQKKKNSRIRWSLFKILPYSIPLYFIVIMMSSYGRVWAVDENNWFYSSFIAVGLASLLAWLGINRLQKHHETDLSVGKELTCLKLIDKEKIGSICVLIFEPLTRLPVDKEVYAKVEVNQYYWVGKTIGSKQYVSITSEDKHISLPLGL
jgi:hypothetical protein